MAGTWDLKSSNADCQLFKSTTNTSFMLYKLTNNGTGAATEGSFDLTSALSGDSSVTWTISADCLKIKSETGLYMASAMSGTYASSTNTTSWLATDSTMNYALTASAILKYSGSSFTEVYSFVGLTLGATSTLSADGGNLLVVEATASDVQAFAFVDNNGNLTEVFTHTSAGYTSAPSVQTSPLCTKILISGKNGSAFATYFFFIDYAAQASTELTFPSSSVLDPANVRLLVDDSWLYVRQLASSLQSVSGGNLEYVYAIVFDSLIEMADVRNISAADEVSNTGTFLRVLPNSTLYVLSIHTSAGLLVKRWQILGGEGQESGDNANLGISQVVIDG